MHGNHEQRPFAINTYQEVEKFGAKAYMEKEFNNLIFAKDGEIYNFDGLQTIVIGGAYSVDKFYRLANDFPWFSNEQPSDEIKKYVEKQLENKNWKIDLVLSHTCPFNYRPIEVFSEISSQNIIDNSTEKWLQTIENKLEYATWYCGHFHINKKYDKFRFLFEDILELK